MEPVHILQGSLWIEFGFFLGVFSAPSRSFQVVRLVYVTVWRKQVVHDDEMNLSSPGQLDPMQAVKAREQCVWIVLYVLMIVLEDGLQKLMFRVMNSLDDEAIVSRKVEERARFAGRSQLREDIFCRQREQIVGRVEMEIVFTKLPEYPWCIVLELEVVSCRRCKFVPDTDRSGFGESVCSKR